MEGIEPRRRRVDWAIGILLGLVLGVAVVAAFVFFGSEGAIDSAGISGAGGKAPPAQSRQRPAEGTAPRRAP